MDSNFTTGNIADLFNIFTQPFPQLSQTIQQLNPNRRSNRLRDNDIHIDVVDGDRFLFVYVEVPGVVEENIRIDIFNNEITLEIRKNPTYENPEFSEIRYGEAKRVITLPICVTRADTVQTRLHNGILRISINKSVEEANRFTISVGTESDGRDGRDGRDEDGGDRDGGDE